MALQEVVYTAHATATGGREGTAKSDDGKLEVNLDPPKAMGGGGTGTNPEQLFAAGYAACFIGSIKFLATSKKIKVPSDISVDSSVSFGPLADGGKGFGIAVDMIVHIPGMERQQAESIVHEAHEICPYSNATRNNIDVKITVA